MNRLLLTFSATFTLGLAACATAPSATSPKLVTICMPCGNSCEFPCTPEAPKAVAAASFDPPQGYYSDPPMVKLATATPGAKIHYTTDGTDPTATSPAYAGPIAVTGDTNIKALAIASEMPPSEISSGAYVVAPRR